MSLKLYHSIKPLSVEDILWARCKKVYGELQQPWTTLYFPSQTLLLEKGCCRLEQLARNRGLEQFRVTSLHDTNDVKLSINHSSAMLKYLHLLIGASRSRKIPTTLSEIYFYSTSNLSGKSRLDQNSFFWKYYSYEWLHLIQVFFRTNYSHLPPLHL